jgi:hypothetical protein
MPSGHPVARAVADPPTAAGMRFLVEIIAWIAAPWALARTSVVLAVIAAVVLIGLPTVFGARDDKRTPPVVAVPPFASIGLELLQVVAAVVFSFVAWPVWAGIVVIVVTVIACALQLPRWRLLLSR